ncbi:PcfJ domain-containing protein [Paenibacillus lautus]|uniref:PcfJ domain-containing protein n=1 Tax=Paenibacillus lautus TaxID=1401 RepID=UPI003D27F05B
MNKEEKDYRVFNRHFPKSISQRIKDYVTNAVLRDSRYIFIRRVARVQFGYCTHCQKRFQTGNPLKHNDMATCPKCESICHVRNHGTSRKYLVDRGFVVYYEKSKIDPDRTIIARAFKVSRNYSGDYTKVETVYLPVAKYVFTSGNPGMAEMYECSWWNKSWHKRASVCSVEDKSIYANNYCSTESIEEAIKGTPFEYSTWDQHEQPQWDYVKFFALYSKYPSVEYITKLGFDYFIRAKLFDLKTYGCINWNGKSIEQILQLNKQDLKVYLEYKDYVSAFQFRLYQISRVDNNRPTIEEIVQWSKDVGDSMELIKPILKHANLRRIMNYSRKQLHRPEKERYKSISDILTAWRDYLKECAILEFDLKDSRTVFPSNLFAAHQKTMQMVTHKQNELIDMKISKRISQLKSLAFEDDNYLIRPAESSWELVEEGKALSICVGTYAEDYANGKTAILLVRRKNEQSTPFYTVEIQGRKIRQIQGYKHKSPTYEVNKFMNDFVKSRIEKKQISSKETEAAV